jgi:hypothetical protein
MLENVTAPVVIGGTGGSGTRVVARIVRHAGFFIGRNLNDYEDAMEFVETNDRWINRYSLRDIAPLSQEEESWFLRDYTASVKRHRSPMPADHLAWGWKEPRSIYVLTYLHQHWPELKFIHVIRDGRDMACSSNQNQLRKHGAAVLRHELQGLAPAVGSASLWARINVNAGSYGETQMDSRYLRVKYESLCEAPESSISEILRFLGAEDARPTEQMLAEVSPPATIGRWRVLADSTTLASIRSVAGDALERFGYV